MTARLLDGKALAEASNAEVAAKVAARVGAGERPPGLAVVLVGQDPASQVYVRNKGKVASKLGFHHRQIDLPADSSEQAVLAVVDQLAQDEAIDGILVQLPLPRHINVQRVMDRIPPHKDVDGITATSAGRLSQARPTFVACTPQGCMRLLAHASADGEDPRLAWVGGTHAVVLGRSNIVGRPMAMLLEQANATVTVCHSRSRDLAAEVRRADVIVAAVGQAALVKGDWVKPGAVVIDVGMNRDAAGRLCGDVDFSAASERAAAITPVPGGVGPMTIAMLMRNTLLAASLGAAGVLGGCTATGGSCDSGTESVKIVDWHTNVVGTDADLHGAQLTRGAGTGTGYAVGAGGAAAYTDDGGEHWTVGTPSSADLFDVARTDRKAALAVGAGGVILAAPGEDTFAWADVDSGTTADLFAVDLVDQNGAIAGDGALLRTSDGGDAWDVTELSGTFRAVTARNVTPWAVGDAGAAAAWETDHWAVRTIANEDFTAVAFTDADHGVIAGPTGTWVTADAGVTWHAAGSPPSSAITSLTVTVDQTAFFGTTADGQVVRSQNQGETWLTLYESGVAGLAGISVWEDDTMPNSQVIATGPGDQVAIYGTRFEQQPDDGWTCD